MKARVKEGKRYGTARAGEIIDVPEHKIALVPWCLEPAPEIVDNMGEFKPAPEKKPAKKK